MQTLINANCLGALANLEKDWFDCAFADPPDNINLKYADGSDALPEDDYLKFLGDTLKAMMRVSRIVWLSFNARWTLPVGGIAFRIMHRNGDDWEFKPCVQTFTFGQHNKHDLGNCHRPLWRFRRKDAPIYPDQVRTESWRQRNGDKRANPEGRVPGDVFEFPRVTGNSKQRRQWHPTQLHEGLVERCILLSTLAGGSVLDPFAGTGTTLRVCDRIGRDCTTIEKSLTYCAQIAMENGLQPKGKGVWMK